MKNYRNQKHLYALLMIFAITASGCSLAPKEEVLPDAPVIPTSAIKEYQKAKVIRGDIIDSVTIDCTYKAFQTEELKFRISGLPIDHVYVEEGDYVKAGDVLADLEMSDISRQIGDRTDNLELLNLRLTHQNELRQLAISNQKKLKSITGYDSQLDSKYNQEISGYDHAIAKLKDDLYIEQERLDQLKEDVKNHQIIAGMDGIVSFVASHQNGDTSDKGTKFITIYDPNTMVFVTDGTNSEQFTKGQKVDITVSGVVYPGVVISPEGLTSQDSKSTDKGAVYLEVDNSGTQLHKDDQGEITLIRNELKDILYLPVSAVHDDNGKTIVYVEDDGGFKSIKEVETGMKADRKVEIISGLNEGDSVILE
ncbi:MAG TPA: biotin/lipoyl-binding protein [Mobilitalea sp.]|nr:biotin/lipoyl-binding protein [Mobilitalea sp.]